VNVVEVLNAAKDEPLPAVQHELVKAFQEWLVSPERQRMDAWVRKGLRFYPSSLAYECDRSMALNFCKAEEGQGEGDPRLQITFDLGNGIHEVLQKRFAQFAVTRGWDFTDEVRIKPEENHWFVSGRVDGVLHLPLLNVRKGIEIKSINEEGFKALWKAPQDAHIIQGNVYVGLKNLDAMHYLYVNKNRSTFKEFVLPFDASRFQDTMSRLEGIIVLLQKGKLPTCGNCTRRCAFYDLNKRLPNAQMKDVTPDKGFTNEIYEALEDWSPRFL